MSGVRCGSRRRSWREWSCPASRPAVTATARVWLIRDTFVGNQGAVYTAGPGAVAYLDGSLFISNPSTSFGIDAAGGPIYTRFNNTIRGTTISPNFLPYSAQ